MEKEEWRNKSQVAISMMNLDLRITISWKQHCRFSYLFHNWEDKAKKSKLSTFRRYVNIMSSMIWICSLRNPKLTSFWNIIKIQFTVTWRKWHQIWRCLIWIRLKTTLSTCSSCILFDWRRSTSTISTQRWEWPFAKDFMRYHKSSVLFHKMDLQERDLSWRSKIQLRKFSKHLVTSWMKNRRSSLDITKTLSSKTWRRP